MKQLSRRSKLKELPPGFKAHTRDVSINLSTETGLTCIGRHRPDEVATTIMTVEEQRSAWYTVLRRAKTTLELVPVYERMSDTIRFLSRLPLLTCTERAAPVYDHLRRQKPRIDRRDLRITAITISHHAALVTRNLCDFEAIDGLTVVD